MSAKAGRHILIVGDAEPTIARLRDILRGAGFRLTVRASAISHRAISAISPDLILLDPGAAEPSAGIELLRRFRADASTAGIPVVLCSGSVEAVRRLDGDVIGPGLGLVMHPIDRGELLTEIAHAMDGSQALAPAAWASHGQASAMLV